MLRARHAKAPPRTISTTPPTCSSSAWRETRATGIYVKQFLDNLVKKYNDNKKGAGFTSGPKIKLLQGQLARRPPTPRTTWASIKTGLEMLKINPWDVSTLTAMADACDALQFRRGRVGLSEAGAGRRSQGRGGQPHVRPDAGAVGRSSTRRIACWHRVRAGQARRRRSEPRRRRPGDRKNDQPRRLRRGREQHRRDGRQGGRRPTSAPRPAAKLSPVQQLERADRQEAGRRRTCTSSWPICTPAKSVTRGAEKVLTTALEVSGGEMSIRERLEDAQLRPGAATAEDRREAGRQRENARIAGAGQEDEGRAERRRDGRLSHAAASAIRPTWA